MWRQERKDTGSSHLLLQALGQVGRFAPRPPISVHLLSRTQFPGRLGNTRAQLGCLGGRTSLPWSSLHLSSCTATEHRPMSHSLGIAVPVSAQRTSLKHSCSHGEISGLPAAILIALGRHFPLSLAPSQEWGEPPELLPSPPRRAPCTAPGFQKHLVSAHGAACGGLACVWQAVLRGDAWEGRAGQGRTGLRLPQTQKPRGSTWECVIQFLYN